MSSDRNRQFTIVAILAIADAGRNFRHARANTRLNCSRVVVNKSLDRSSPALISRAAANTWIPEVVISLRKAGPALQDFYTATLDSVLIERIDLADQNNTLTEQIVLRPRSIRIEYRPQDDKGELLPPIVSTIACN